MQNQSDKELDDLFKKAAEQSEDDTALPDWSDMSARLDRAKPGGYRPMISAMIVSVILVSSVTVGWVIINRSKVSKIEVTDADATQDVSRRILPQQDVKSTGREEIENEYRGNTDRSPTRAQLGNINSNKSALSSEVDSHQFTNDSRYSEKDDSGEFELPKNMDMGKNENSISDNESRVEVPYDSLLEKMQKIPVARITKEMLVELDTAESNTNEERFERGFSVKLALSPDYSMVHSSRPQGLGINSGILLEYSLSKNLSIATGVIRARKKYSAYKVEYSGYETDIVEGDCRMWDIPISVYYHFSPGKTWLFYSGVGLSSYLMSQESYVYYVEGSYGQRKTFEHSVNGKNTEWFSILNVSVGIEKKLNQKFAIQFEPFYKAPLAGVGEGDVSLASFGAFFMLKYNMNQLKSN